MRNSERETLNAERGTGNGDKAKLDAEAVTANGGET